MCDIYLIFAILCDYVMYVLKIVGVAEMNSWRHVLKVAGT